MPLPVTPWAVNTFPTAKSLDLACYTCDGTLNKPNGIAFHARRPMTGEVLNTAISFPSAPSGKRTVIDASPAHWYGTTIIDNAGYYGQSSDGSYPASAYHLAPAITGSAGDGTTPGGIVIVGHFLPLSSPASQQTAGADLSTTGGVLVSSGARQVSCNGHDSCPFYLDLLDVTGGVWQPSVTLTDSSSAPASSSVNLTDSSGETPRFFTLWAGVSAGNQAAYGTPASPAPYAAFTAATDIGTTPAATVNLNGPNGVAGPLNFLSSPPLVRASMKSGQAIPSGTRQQVALSPDLDSSNGWFSPYSYFVQRDGLYLAHGVTPYTAHGAGSRQAGIQVNGTPYWGPPYPGTSAGTVIPTKTQILDLAAGDQVNLVTRQNSGSVVTLAGGDESRMFLTWLGARGVPASAWTPPDLSFRWQAGTPGASLDTLFQQHVANDLGFLVSRPYLLAYQTVAQSGFAATTPANLNPDTVAGIVHGTPGDNYGGWRGIVSGGTTIYSYYAQRPGWYLCVLEGFATFPVTTSTCALIAVLSAPSSGGRAPTATLGDWYQHIFPSTATWNPGATAVGLYYLLAGESVTPQLIAQDWTAATWGTAVAPGVATHFEMVWVSE